MRTIAILILSVLISTPLIANIKTIHVFVALCDNANQGIIPVPAKFGNGKDSNNNLYWGAMYGVKSFFKYRTEEWTLIKTIPTKSSLIIERILFKHKTENIYMLADAYDGAKIKNCIEDFLKSANKQEPIQLTYNSQQLNFGGNADLLAYIGHDGLMEFNLNINYNESVTNKMDVIILACISKNYFEFDIKQAQANPILWTNHFMAPEAYTLKAAIDGWILKETGTQIIERAAQTYHKYQKCGITGARNLFSTGF